jgi:hypothetical protein
LNVRQPTLKRPATRITKSSGIPMPPSNMGSPQNFQARPMLGRIIHPSTTA